MRDTLRMNAVRGIGGSSFCGHCNDWTAGPGQCFGNEVLNTKSIVGKQE